MEEVGSAFGLDEVLNNIWLHITDGSLSSLECIILLGLFGHMENGERILYEIMKKQKNYNLSITHNMVAKYKKFYFPITFHYLYSLYNKDCPPHRKDTLQTLCFLQLTNPLDT